MLNKYNFLVFSLLSSTLLVSCWQDKESTDVSQDMQTELNTIDDGARITEEEYIQIAAELACKNEKYTEKAEDPNETLVRLARKNGVDVRDSKGFFISFTKAASRYTQDPEVRKKLLQEKRRKGCV